MTPNLASLIAGAILAAAAPVQAQMAAPLQPGPPSVQPLRGPVATPANPLPLGPSLLPGTAAPVQPVKPQVQLRFGKVPPVSASASQSARTAEIAEMNRIEDGAARCDALVDEQHRAGCRHDLSQAGKARSAALAASAPAAAVSGAAARQGP